MKNEDIFVVVESTGVFTVITVKMLAEHYKSMLMLYPEEAFIVIGIKEPEKTIAEKTEQDLLAAMAWAHTEREKSPDEIAYRLAKMQFSAPEIIEYDHGKNPKLKKWINSIKEAAAKYRTLINMLPYD